MADEIKQRLQDCADKCLQSYEAWRGDQKDASKREALQDAIHEMRKVTSRLEIEIAVSDRENGAKNKMQAPSNRVSKKPRPKGDGGEGNGNKSEDSKPSKPRRKPAPKKDDNGGGEE